MEHHDQILIELIKLHYTDMEIKCTNFASNHDESTSLQSHFMLSHKMYGSSLDSSPLARLFYLLSLQ